jgi:hypothetical protein
MYWLLTVNIDDPTAVKLLFLKPPDTVVSPPVAKNRLTGSDTSIVLTVLATGFDIN